MLRQPFGRADEQVTLVEAALLERARERFERCLGARGDDDAARLGVEAMDDARLARREADRGDLRIARDERVRERAAFSRGERRGRLAGGLVEHEHAIRFEQHLERRVGVGDGAFRFALGDLDLDRLSGGGDVALRAFAPLALVAPMHAHSPFGEELLRARAPEAGNAIHEELVEPAAYERRVDFDSHSRPSLRGLAARVDLNRSRPARDRLEAAAPG